MSFTSDPPMSRAMCDTYSASWLGSAMLGAGGSVAWPPATHQQCPCMLHECGPSYGKRCSSDGNVAQKRCAGTCGRDSKCQLRICGCCRVAQPRWSRRRAAAAAKPATRLARCAPECSRPSGPATTLQLFAGAG